MRVSSKIGHFCRLNSVKNRLESLMKSLCPDCLKPVEVIKACGCRDYFCNHCNQLVSKRRVIQEEASGQPQKSQLSDVEARP